MRNVQITNKMMDNLINLPFQNTDLKYWTWGVAHLLLGIEIMATHWKKIHQIYFREIRYLMVVDLEKKDSF